MSNLLQWLKDSSLKEFDISYNKINVSKLPELFDCIGACANESPTIETLNLGWIQMGQTIRVDKDPKSKKDNLPKREA